MKDENQFIPPRLNRPYHVIQIGSLIASGYFLFAEVQPECLKGLSAISPWLTPGLIRTGNALLFWTLFYHTFTLLLNAIPSQRRVFPGTQYTVSQYTVAIFHQVVLLPFLLRACLSAFSSASPSPFTPSAVEAQLALDGPLPQAHAVVSSLLDPLWWVCGWSHADYRFLFEHHIWWALIGYQLKDFFYSSMDIFFQLHHLFALLGSALCMLSPLGVGLLTFNCVNAEFGSSAYNLSELLPFASPLLDPLYLVLMTLSNIIVAVVAYSYWLLPLPLFFRGSYLFISSFLVLLRQAGVVRKILEMKSKLNKQKSN